MVRRAGQGLRPYAGDNDAEGWQSSEVQVAAHRLAALALPDQTAPEIAALIADWPDWRRASVTVCPLAGDGDGAICDGLRYDPERGIVFDSAGQS